MKQSTFIVSLDFELFWGMQDCRTLEEYGPNILGGRRAIPKLLELFTKYGIHATWATVGFLFAETPDELQAYLPPYDQQPSYQDSALSTYRYLSEQGQKSELSPYLFALPLIQQIAAVPGQEIASHTFSHYYCREPGQTPEQFEADLAAAQKIAQAHGFTLTSLVLPRNQSEPEYVACLKKLGFTAYRDEENDWIHEKVSFRPLMRLLRLADVYFPLTGLGGYHPQEEQGVVNLIGSRMYKPYFKPLAFLEKQKLRRIKKQMLYAAKNGLTFHLWWHPHNIGTMTDFHLQQMEEIFSYYAQLQQKYGMRSLNMREAAEEIRKG